MRGSSVLAVLGLLVLFFAKPVGAGDAVTRVPLPPVATPTRRAVSFEDWVFWYHANADRLEAEAAGADRLDAWNAAPATRDRILATFRGLIDRRSTLHDFVAAQAVRALARATRDPADVRILERLVQDPATGYLTREAAALGLGMLRRTGAQHAWTAPDLERVRERLFTTVADDHLPSRTRGFAALSLGLLADQGDATSPSASSARTERLLLLLKEGHRSQDVPVGLLIALGRQSPASLSDEGRAELTLALRAGRLYESTIPGLVRAHVALALGGVGGPGVEGILEKVIAARRGVGKNTRRSAAVAWGRLAGRMEADKRADAVRRMLASIKRRKDPSTRHFLTMGLVEPLVRDVGEAREGRRLRSEAAAFLLRLAARGPFLDRPYGALALGLVLRSLTGTAETDATRAFRRQAFDVLREGLADPVDADTRAAFALALGLSRDEPSRDALARMAAEPARDPAVRAYALLGLALMGSDEETYRLALGQWTSPQGNRHVLGLRALGMAASAVSSVDPSPLIDALVREKSAAFKAEAAVALGRMASPETARRLILVALDPKEQDLTRGMAVLALGRMVDPEEMPSLVPLYESVQHRCMTDLTSELMAIQ